MTTEAEVFFRAVVDALPEGWVVVDGPHENLQGKCVVYVAPHGSQGLRVRVQVENA